MEIDLNEGNNKQVDLIKQNNKDIEIKKEQNDFLETTIGKIVNTAVDVGLRFLLPDFLENEVIDVKNILFQEGLKDGVKEIMNKAIDFGKSAIGIFTGKFENINQVQNAVEKGGIIDSVSKLIDSIVNKTNNKGIINESTAKLIKDGKNIILDNIESNIENMLTEQIKAIEKVQEYSNNWKSFYLQKDFSNMEKEYKKIETKMEKIIPLENIIKEVREIENIHNLIKNNGKIFDLTKNQLDVAKILM